MYISAKNLQPLIYRVLFIISDYQVMEQGHNKVMSIQIVPKSNKKNRILFK